MLQCAVCGSGVKSNDRWTTVDQTMGCDSLPYEGKLAHISCKTYWAAKMTHDNYSEKASPGYVTGDVTDRVGPGEWKVREIVRK